MKAAVSAVARRCACLSNISLAKAGGLEIYVCRHCNSFLNFDFGTDVFNLKILDLSHTCINQPDYFLSQTSLEVLLLASIGIHENCLVAQKVSRKKKDSLSLPSDTFIHSTNLVNIQLSSNGMIHLGKDVFKSNGKLKNISLADNKFSSIPFDLKFTPLLEVLDLGGNVIKHLSKYDIQMVTKHVQIVEDFHLILQDNDLVCSCGTMSFLHWLNSTNVHLDNQGNYTCATPDGHTSYTGLHTDTPATQAYTLHTDTRVMWRKSMGQTYFWISIYGTSLNHHHRPSVSYPSSPPQPLSPRSLLEHICENLPDEVSRRLSYQRVHRLCRTRLPVPVPGPAALSGTTSRPDRTPTSLTETVDQVMT